jgi:hypothetical protein
MQARLHFSIALLIVLAAPAIPAAAQDAASAKIFLQSVYAHYAKNGRGATLTSRYYDSTLLRLVTTDNKLNAGDIGVLEGDPVCGCQDWSGIWDLKIDVQMMKDPSLALADVTFALSAPKGRTKDDLRKLQITLVPERGQWRIYNVLDESDPKAPFDLRKALEKDIASLRKGSK